MLEGVAVVQEQGKIIFVEAVDQLMGEVEEQKVVMQDL
jgi:hypothetical protein